MSFDLSDYVDVAERCREFFQRWPEGSLQSEVTFVDGGVLCKAFAYRGEEDARPGIGHAFEPIPGATPYTRNSEVQNAETSAWGRAIVAVGFETKKIASRDEVLARSAGESGNDGQPQGAGAAAGDHAPSPAEKAKAAFDAANPPPEYDGSAESVVLPFGKYKGWTLGDVLKEDKGYVVWLADKYEPKTPAQRLVQNAARALLGRGFDPLPDLESDGIPFAPTIQDGVL